MTSSSAPLFQCNLSIWFVNNCTINCIKWFVRSVLYWKAFIWCSDKMAIGNDNGVTRWIMLNKVPTKILVYDSGQCSNSGDDQNVCTNQDSFNCDRLVLMISGMSLLFQILNTNVRIRKSW